MNQNRINNNYNPNGLVLSANNILPPIKKLNKSASYDIIGDKNINYKWCSIYQKLFRKPQIIPINNSAILSEIPKFIHKNVYN